MPAFVPRAGIYSGSSSPSRRLSDLGLDLPRHPGRDRTKSAAADGVRALDFRRRASLSFLRWRGAPRPGLRAWGMAATIGGGIILRQRERHLCRAFHSIGNGGAYRRARAGVDGLAQRATSQPRLPVWFGIALATLGVAFIVRPSGVSLSPVQSGSIAILLIGELMWSAASLYTASARQRGSGLLMAAMQLLCGRAFMLATAGFRGEFGEFDFAAITVRSLLAMGYLATIGLDHWVLRLSLVVAQCRTDARGDLRLRQSRGRGISRPFVCRRKAGPETSRGEYARGSRDRVDCRS
jgi:hypothetical protein